MQFKDMLKNVESEGKERHVPVIEIGKGKGEGGVDIVHVAVGKETPHPNTVEHHIDWIELIRGEERRTGDKPQSGCFCTHLHQPQCQVSGACDGIQGFLCPCLL